MYDFFNKILERIIPRTNGLKCEFVAVSTADQDFIDFLSSEDDCSSFLDEEDMFLVNRSLCIMFLAVATSLAVKFICKI
jgi:hypothetical protein